MVKEHIDNIGVVLCVVVENFTIRSVLELQIWRYIGNLQLDYINKVLPSTARNNYVHITLLVRKVHFLCS